jgi:dTDP-4-dehydrorhamnose 3,5-epimerase
MSISALEISGCFLIHQKVFSDNRGFFREWFRSSEISEIDPKFSIEQANFSHSKKGVIRGLHYSIAPEGQAKVVTCTSGSVVDVLVDLRVGSPTYLSIQQIELSEDSGLSVFIASGVGHGFQVLSATGSMMYVTSSVYSPSQEKGISPIDPTLHIEWPILETSLVTLSGADQNAPSLTEASNLGILPIFNPS